ncbi:MAG: hypothetical protein E7603_09140 [Ruminococcaceae bacterium]|nr:hypothetical protein [Oscillospiraceae bacterium]
MKEFNEHGERIEKPKKKRRGLFSGYEKDGKGIDKDDVITKYDFLSFFKLYFRRFIKLIWVNALYIVGNFPIFFLLLAISGIFSDVGVTPSSEVFPVINGIHIASGELTPSFASLFGIHGQMVPVYADTVVTYILYGLSALAIFTFGPVNAACTYIVRNLVKGEHVFMWDDFKSTIKSSWKQSLPMGILDLIMLAMCTYALYLYYYNYANYYMMFYPMLLVFILYIFMRFYIYTLMVTFDLKFFQIIKNAAIFTLLGFGRNFLLFCGCVMLVMFTIWLGTLFVPLAVISIFMVLFSGCAYMGMYAAWPKIQKYMIDPYYKKSETE